MNEEWKPVVGFEGLYEVSTFGSVRNAVTGHVMHGEVTSSGYRRVSLTKNSKISNERVHRLVASAFLPNPDVFKEVNHKNGDRLCNCAWNLEWTDRASNQKHAYDHGLCRMSKSRVERIKKSMPKKPVVRSDGKTFSSISEAARATGVNVGTISGVLHGKRDKAAGFGFKFIPGVD